MSWANDFSHSFTDLMNKDKVSDEGESLDELSQSDDEI